MKDYKIVTIIAAVVVIIAIWIATKVEFSMGSKGVTLSTDKTNQNDKVSVEDVAKSTVDIENRKDQDISVKKVTDDSNVKIK